MSLEINITPTIEDSRNGYPTTRLEVIVDITSIQKQLEQYDLLLQTKLEVKTDNLNQYNIYEAAQIYRNVHESTIKFDTIVLGYITDIKNIRSGAEAVFLRKQLS